VELQQIEYRCVPRGIYAQNVAAEASLAAAAAAERARELEEAENNRRKTENADEAARRKAMIMQYAETISGEDAGAEEEQDVDESIEDWELTMWADHREVQKKNSICVSRRAKLLGAWLELRINAPANDNLDSMSPTVAMM